MIINHNMNAMNAHRNMMSNISKSGKSMEKLSSGLRINRAGDDAAGLAISEKMRGQIRGLDQATRNSQDGISMIQTAEGALNETHSILQRMKELATQAANDTNTSSDRGQIQKEINQLTSEINRIGNTTEFNTQKLLNGNSPEESVAPQGASVKLTDISEKFKTDLTSLAKININTKDVTLTNTKKLNGTTTEFKAEDLAKALQQDIDATDLKGELTVTANEDGKGITLTTTEKGEDVELNITASGDTKALGLTADDSTDISEKGVSAKEFSATLQIGANKGQAFKISVADMRSKALGISKDKDETGNGFAAKADVTNGTTDETKEVALDMSSHDSATASIKVLDDAINTVSTERSRLGAYQNRLEHTINNLGTASENLTAAESRVRDVDMAKEMMTFSKKNILSQAAQAMLAQANQQPQGVLQLLR